jgi:hypothetical protein
MNGTQVFRKPETLEKEKKGYAHMTQRYKQDIIMTMHDRHIKQMDMTKPIGASTDFVNMLKSNDERTQH